MTHFLMPFASDLPAALRISSASAPAIAQRQPIKHLLIGAPPIVRLTIHELHVRGYAEATAWSSFLPLPLEDEGRSLIITPNPGDVMSTLIKYVRWE